MCASPFYDYQIIARTGVAIDGFTAQTFKQSVSINDSNRVAFIAEGAGGSEAVFIANLDNATPVFHKLVEKTVGDFGSVSLNNKNKAAVNFRAVGAGITSANVRRYAPTSLSGGLSYASADIAQGTTARRTVTFNPCLPRGDCPFTQRFREEAYDDILGPVSLNDSDQVAYLGLVTQDSGQRSYHFTVQDHYPVPKTTDAFSITPYQAYSLLPEFRPVLANSGHIVARVGGQANSPILLYSPGFASPIQAVAGAASFIRIGQAPGLSDGGFVVAFVGDRGNGPGLFLSVTNPANPSGPRMILRLAGENASTNGPTAELGYDANTNKLYFDSFDADAKVGVIHFPQGDPADGIDEDSITVCFSATPNASGSGPNAFSANKGLWAIRVDVDGTLQPVVSGLYPVVQLGDPLPGVTDTVTDFALSDPIAVVATDDGGNAIPLDSCAHRIAFTARTASKSFIATATQIGGSISIHQLEDDALDLSPPPTIDTPLRPRPSVTVSTLEKQPKVRRGLVADGVTPLLIRFQPQQPPVALTTYHLSLAIEGGTISNTNITNYLSVYSGTEFTKGTEFNLSPASPVGFAYLEGFRAEDIHYDPGETEVLVVVAVQDDAGRGCSKAFKIRKPPIVLVHGYASDSNTWSPPFLAALEAGRPHCFLVPVNYGVLNQATIAIGPFLVPPNLGLLKGRFYPNSFLSFERLAKMLDQELLKHLENPAVELRRDWALTRYDIVGHSQGGVLARMLCADDRAFVTRPDGEFVHARNRFRGRFRRIITIGSPHNGTTLYPYATGLQNTPVCKRVPVLFDLLGLLQDKFDPWGQEIRFINNDAHSPNSRALFHLLSSRLESCPLLFYAPGLCLPTQSSIVIPEGSDGIVDYASQNGGFGSNAWSLVSGARAHALGKFFTGLNFIPPEEETGSPQVAARVIELLDGPADRFAPFDVPPLLSEDKRNAIKRVLPSPLFCVDLINRAIPSPTQQSAIAQAASGGVVSFDFSLTPLPEEPMVGSPVWFVEVFGTNGVTTEGVRLTSNQNIASIQIEPTVQGDVVLYAAYTSVNGTLVHARPVVVTSRPPGLLARIAVVPAEISLPVGGKFDLEIWGVYDNGTAGRLFIPPDEPATFTSSTPAIVDVTQDGMATLKTNGNGMITVSFRGFTTQSVISTLPAFVPPQPPVAVADNGITAAGQSVVVNVLTNDSDPDGDIAPSTVTLTRNPTNGTASVDTFTGAITYTPNPGATNLDTFRYTVRDDLGTLSPEALVTVQIFAPAQAPGPTSPRYYVDVRGVSVAPRDQKFPRLNNHGDVVWQERINGLWQVRVNDGRGQITLPDYPASGPYSEATSPAIADDGSVIYYRTATNSASLPKDILLHPSLQSALTNPAPKVIYRSTEQINSLRFEYGTYQPTPSLTSDGKPVKVYQHTISTLNQNVDESWLSIGTNTADYSNPSFQYDRPDANAQGDFIFLRGNQVFLNNQSRLNADAASIGDAPRENPDIVHVVAGNLRSSVVGQLIDESGQPLTGSWVDVNRSGVLVYEKQAGGFSKVFKAWPMEPRIISTGATNALVGFPYQFDADNIVEAYGGEPEEDDPRGITPLTWYVENAPPGFSIDPDTAFIQWTPETAGVYTFSIIAANDSFLGPAEHRYTLTVHVRQSAFEPLVDAMDFRVGNSPDFVANASAYYTGGQSRVGVVADGASRLVLRVKLEGVNSESAQSLHFVIAGTNGPSGRDGSLLALGATNWEVDVPATLVSSGGTNKVICLYESPLDYDTASQPVTVQLRHGNRVIAAQTIPLIRPPVVLVHDGWNGPTEWNVMFSELLDAGLNVHFFDYALASGGNPSSVADQLFLKTSEALSVSRDSGFAASQVDIVAHGSGAVIARLHAQRYAAQGPNYHKGDVHKLISIGGAHGGSHLADVISALKNTNAAAYTNLRSAVITASEAAGYFPPVDLNQGLVEALTLGSSALTDLKQTHVPGHAIATTAGAGLPADIYGLIHFYLGLPVKGDGFVTPQSALGGMVSNATSVFPNIAHPVQAAESNIAALVVSLLRAPVSASNLFGFFPDYSSVTWSNGHPTSPGGLAVGNWLTLTASTNVVMPGQTITATASAGGGRTLQSVYFLASGGGATIAAAPYDFAFTVPGGALGTVKVTAIGRDTGGQLSVATLSLSLPPAEPFQSIEVEPANLVMFPSLMQRVTVWGVYSNGLRRDISSVSAGTRYRSSDGIRVGVDSNGVVTARQPTVSPVSISITNVNPAFPANVFLTNIVVSVLASNLPPTARITSARTSGPAPFDVVFSGVESSDPRNESLDHHWSFGDGTYASGATPTMHRYLAPGEHEVVLTVTDPAGLIGMDRMRVTVESRLVVDGIKLILPGQLSYRESSVINGGELICSNQIDCGNLVMDSGVLTNFGQLVLNHARITNASRLTLIGPCHASSFFLNNTSIVTGVPMVPLRLSSTNGLWIDESSRISVVGHGYPHVNCGPGSGPGGGTYGGSHGGLGGFEGLSLACYGSYAEPSDFGSAGGGYCNGINFGIGGWGGGIIKLFAKQVHADGTITADGANGNAGSGGAGGSVWIIGNTISGSGTIRANGGFPHGGGGRVAIYSTNQNGFTGSVQARGVGGDPAGGAGTVYWSRSEADYGDLVVDNGGQRSAGWSTPLKGSAPITLSRLLLGSQVSVDVQAPMTVTNELISLGTNSQVRLLPGAWVERVHLGNSNSLTIHGELRSLDITVSNDSKLTLAGMSWAANVSLLSRSELSSMEQIALELVVTNQLVVDANSRINASGLGYPHLSGPGRGSISFGGSHGGLGGNVPIDASGASPTYGSYFAPVDFGSGSYSKGGGVITLHCGILQLDGMVEADGLRSSGASAGAGGSIWITTDSLSGTGVIRANGGEADILGGGGGGRVAMYYSNRSAFSGLVQASGGSTGPSWDGGGAGTVYWKALKSNLGELIVDNGGRSGRFGITHLEIPAITRFSSWLIRGGAKVVTDAGVRVTHGDPAYFGDLIRSNYLQVGGLLVSNTWVHGDVMDLEIRRQEAGGRSRETAVGSQGMALVTVYCRPDRTYLLLASTNFLDWIPVATNTPTGSRFDFLDSDTPRFGQRHFRAVMLEHLYDNLGLTMQSVGLGGTSPYQTRVTVTGARPGHTLILQASPDLRRWTSLATNTPITITNWPFLDTNASAYPQRFYRAIGQGK